MSTYIRNDDLLKRTGKISDMEALLALKDLSQDKRREIEIHKLIASALAGASMKGIPTALRQSLYEIEKKPRIDFAKVHIRSGKELVSFLSFATAVFLVIMLPLFFNNEMLRMSTAIAAGSAYIFYELFKSKFFFYR